MGNGLMQGENRAPGAETRPLPPVGVHPDTGGVEVHIVGGGTAGGALATTQTDGTQKAIVRGGAKGATAAADVTSTANGADHQGLDVAEQLAPQAEDNANGVLAMVQKPLASALYAPSLSKDFGSVTKAVVKASAGNVLAVHIVNTNAAARYFQLHNKATAPVATEVPIYSIRVPAGAALQIDGGFFCGSGAAFTTGIGWAWSTTAATFTDAATAADHTTHLHYK
jgi:hypothetical protein